MHEQTGGDAVAVYSCKAVFLFFGIVYYSANQCSIQRNNDCASKKTPLFANGAEYKIGALLRHKIKLGLSSV